MFEASPNYLTYNVNKPISYKISSSLGLKFCDSWPNNLMKTDISCELYFV